MTNYTTWTARDGRTLRIVELDSDHLYNIIKMIERTAKKQHTVACSKVPYWDADDVAMMPELRWFIHPAYDALMCEVQNRGSRRERLCRRRASRRCVYEQ
jgi:hypothetical protein